MRTSRFSFVCAVALLLTVPSLANNVKIVGDIKVTPSEIQSNIAPFEFTVTWENSWRDEFNYDAVYIFLKYKLDEQDQTWNHLYLTNNVTLTPTTTGDTYAYSLISSTNNQNRSEGIILYRDKTGFGPSSVKVSLNWNITSGVKSLTTANFNDGKVFMSAMAVELVYVPQGAFRVGDTYSEKAFTHKSQSIPAQYDLVAENYRLLTNGNVVNAANPPAFAANRMNDISAPVGDVLSNAWLGNGSGDQYWMIDFGTQNGQQTGEKKTVKYIAIESAAGFVPDEWELYGLQDESEVGGGKLLYSGKAADWEVSCVRSYPTTRRLKISNTTAYRFYKVKISKMGSAKGPAIRTISMAEADLDAVMDNSVLINEITTNMTDKSGYVVNNMYSTDGEIQGDVATTNEYPNGYRAFYTMKYEISQEQYVAFLNKLTLAQQATRTIKDNLTSLNEGQYVFGTDRENPTNRNGIVLASRNGARDPLVFANNLNKTDKEFAQDGDGQTLACNFLTPADMLAYADWTGLRPMTEMEYEKMSRRPFPADPLRGEYAWNSTNFTAPTGIQAGTEGKKSEWMNGGNANAGNVTAIGGPVRVGAFAKGASSQEKSGASFWGVLDLSGNSAEIYYNVNVEGRKFRGISRTYQGDGLLDAIGNNTFDVASWPVHFDAFTLKGGSFQTTATKELATSDRTYHKGVYKTMEVDERKAEVTFRLGCSYPAAALPTYLTMENGLRTTAANTYDTICSGEDYLITGDIPEGLTGAYSIAWFYSGNGGKTWDLVEGEYGKDLRIGNVRNIHVGDNVFKEYWYIRQIYSSNQDAKSKIAVIRVVNHEVILLPGDKTSRVNVLNSSIPIQIKSTLPVNVTWKYANNANKGFMYTITNQKNYVHYLRYTDFNDGTQQVGEQKLVLNWQFYNGFCKSSDTITVQVAKAPVLATSSTAVKCGQSFYDSRTSSNVTYYTVPIGTQCWMANNLNYPASGSKCYADNENNCEKYGRLYNWTTTMAVADGYRDICPLGWHVPNDGEWGNMFDANKQGKDQPATGRDLKTSTNEWAFLGGETGMGANTKGFSALPGGGYFYAQSTGFSLGVPGMVSRQTGFYDMGNAAGRAWWWTSSLASGCTWYAYSNVYPVSIPYYIMLDTDGTYYRNTKTFENWFNYMTNSIFFSRHYGGNNSGNAAYLANNGDNTTAQSNINNQFYFSVRCVRNTELTADEQ